MDKAKDKTLYKKVKEEVYKKNPVHGAYRSMQVVKEYKSQGGTFKNTNNKPLTRWLDEQWIAIKPYITTGSKVPCGSPIVRQHSACRPSRRVSKQTPQTIQETLTKHSREDILKAINKKNKDPHNTTLNWHTLKLTKR